MKITTPSNLKLRNQIGFTLIEMTIVLFIVALLLGGLVPTLSGQIEQRRLTETRTQLDTIRDALIGYSLINGRLPCPASAASNGVEAPVNTGVCSNFNNGFVPAVTLGLSGTSTTGYIEDAWGNPLRYAVSSWDSIAPPVVNVFTTDAGIRNTGISNLSLNLTPNPNLVVCSAASAGATNCLEVCTNNTKSVSDCSAANFTLSSNAVAVIYSIGPNGASGGSGTDETENPNPSGTNNNRVFVSHTPSAITSPNGEFDDIVIWISPNILVNRMVSAGILP